jgi:hypothetical protein
MKLHPSKISLTTPIAFLSAMSVPFLPSEVLPLAGMRVVAQTEADRKTEAERLLKLCREHLSHNQPEAAIQSCQQAVTAHQQIKDLSGEAKSTVKLFCT